jgi:hypothetical protein
MRNCRPGAPRFAPFETWDSTDPSFWGGSVVVAHFRLASNERFESEGADLVAQAAS